MKTRVRTHNNVYKWQIDILNPDTDEWVMISLHNIFWYANWKATRLSRKSLDIKIKKKEEFLDRLKGIHKNPNKAAIGCPP